MVNPNTPMARAFFDHNDQKRQKARRTGANQAPTRLDLSALPGLVACWDASYAAALPAGAESGMPTLGDRIIPGNALTSAFAAPNQPVLIPGPPRSMFSTTGGNSQRRFNAPTDVGDSLFAGGGMIFSVQSTASAAGKLIAKWSETSFLGWLLVGASASTMRFEAWSDTANSTNFNFTIPTSQTFLLEIEWNSNTPTVTPVVRINGVAVTVTVTSVFSTQPVNDTVATLCIGNMDWGPMNAPWNGTIGEVVLLNEMPTDPQKAALRADLMSHWSIT